MNVYDNQDLFSMEEATHSHLVLHSFPRPHLPELSVKAWFLLNVNCVFSLAHNFTSACAVVSCDCLWAVGLAKSLPRLTRRPQRTLEPCPAKHPVQTNRDSLSSPLSFNKQQMLINHLLLHGTYCYDKLRIQQLLAQ